MQLGLSEKAILNHQAYDTIRDSVIKRHIQWNASIDTETDGGHFEYLL